MSGPSISIDGSGHPILCGFCKAPVAFGTEADGHAGQVGCAACGNWDEPDEAARKAVEFAKIEAQLILNRAARDAARRSKLLKFSGKTTHDRTHPFIVELKI